MILYVARHGQTKWNVENKVLGRTDVSLDEIGKKQATKLANSLKNESVSCIYTSPLVRAKETAEIVSQVIKAPVCVCDMLIEQDFGVFEGAQRNNREYLSVKRKILTRYPNGESYFDVVTRIYPFLDDLKIKHENEQILLVTHNGICRIIESYFNDMDINKFIDFSLGNGEYLRYK